MAHLSADKKEDIERANKLRDLRTYNTLQGNEISDMTTPFARNLNDLDMRKFKRTGDLDEALTMLPDLVTRALERANGNPEKLQKELVKIKRNSYQTMPNPERWPLSFMNYVAFLSKTQGEEVASERVLDYLKQNAVNQAKVAPLK
jgi:hypothetical protein